MKNKPRQLIGSIIAVLQPGEDIGGFDTVSIGVVTSVDWSGLIPLTMRVHSGAIVPIRSPRELHRVAFVDEMNVDEAMKVCPVQFNSFDEARDFLQAFRKPREIPGRKIVAYGYKETAEGWQVIERTT